MVGRAHPTYMALPPITLNSPFPLFPFSPFRPSPLLAAHDLDGKVFQVGGRRRHDHPGEPGPFQGRGQRRHPRIFLPWFRANRQARKSTTPGQARRRLNPSAPGPGVVLLASCPANTVTELRPPISPSLVGWVLGGGRILITLQDILIPTLTLPSQGGG